MLPQDPVEIPAQTSSKPVTVKANQSYDFILLVGITKTRHARGTGVPGRSVWLFCLRPNARMSGGGRGVYLPCCRGNKRGPHVDDWVIDVFRMISAGYNHFSVAIAIVFMQL